MAAGSLAAPGTKLGPCLPACEHTDCAATRRMAATVCAHCPNPIGYDTAFYDVGSLDDKAGTKLAHQLCEIDHVRGDEVRGVTPAIAPEQEASS